MAKKITVTDLQTIEKLRNKKGNNTKWKKLLKTHKTMMLKLKPHSTDPDMLNALITEVVDQAEKLCLHFTDYECENPKCKSTNNLTFHHMIERRNKEFIKEYYKYLSARHYWNNIIILCRNCHSQYHRQNRAENMNPISITKINEIKKYFEYEKQHRKNNKNSKERKDVQRISKKRQDTAQRALHET